MQEKEEYEFDATSHRESLKSTEVGVKRKEIMVENLDNGGNI